MSTNQDRVLRVFETGRAIHVDRLAEKLEIEPEHIRNAIGGLRAKGYCIKNEGHGTKMFKLYQGC